MSFKNLEGQTAQWIQSLLQYNFTSEHHQDRNHNNTDALSRRPCQEECTLCHKDEMRANVKQVRAIAALEIWDPVAQKGTAKWHRYRAHFTGIRYRTTTGVERHYRPKSHIQTLLGSEKISRCEKWQTRAQLGIRQRTIRSSPNSYFSEESEERADRTIWWTVRSPGCQQNPE
jgi:hypothetical protein